MSRSINTATGRTKKSGNNGAVPSTRTQAFEMSTQRSKSRSPSRNAAYGSGSRSDPFTLLSFPPSGAGAPTATVKRKRSTTSVGASTAPSSNVDDVDRGQRVKPKSSSMSGHQNRVSSSSAVASGSTSSLIRPKKERERERARAPAEYANPYRMQTSNALSSTEQLPNGRRGIDKGKAKQVVESEMGVVSRLDTPTYSGALAAAEFERMRKELEMLKRTVDNGKKQLRKQHKTIEELRAQMAAESLEHGRLLVAANAKSRKNEELLQTIEVSLQCQICIELLSKPNVLTPCGHVFCLECLQQWFRSAPGTDSDDMDTEAHEQYLLHREKACPCCRTRVLRRPVPVFLVKSVVTALRGTPAAAAPPTVGVQGEEGADPWKGLFLPDYESSDEDDEEIDGFDSSEDEAVQYEQYYSEEDLDDLDDAEVAMGLSLGIFPPDMTPFYGSASESEEEGSEPASDEEGGGAEDDEEDSDNDGNYSLARWEPPTHVVQFENISSSLWKMQRRGCTPQLMTLFNMRYAHDEGLVAHVSSLDATDYEDVGMGRNRLFLGWNIDLEPSDVEGEAEKMYIAHQLRDIKRHPERWVVSERHGFPGRGIMDARRLSPAEEDVEIYDTSDSEAYSNGEEFM
ncbi:hypothetical protein B0H16DRAFT_1504743 [Mycena metata]|uniref:RING-type domain-containing protein n=1 Tax=Mycena metata TaxID=1033252 RepID=A0AAD7NW05_9AGAR|nr:hypothetical protein B0H16DRAFT_1504743 [Mycena metata]